MKGKKFFSALLACALFMGIMQFSAVAATSSVYAGNEYRGEGTYIVSNNSEYKGFSILTVSDSFQASTQISFVRDLESTFPSTNVKYLAYQARLYTPSRLSASSKIEKSTTTYLPVVTTSAWRGDQATSRGWVEYNLKNGTSNTMFLNASPTISKNRFVAVEECILESFKDSLNETYQYPVNQSGESYGSGLLAEIVGEEPDLIEAIGVNGIVGYVRAEELEADYDVPPEEDVIISVYDLDGLVVDTFVLNGREMDGQ